MKLPILSNAAIDFAPDDGSLQDRANPQKKQVHIRTYGCQMNQYDTDKLYRILADRYDRTDDAKGADLVLVNTCSVRDKPEQKLYSLLGELRELKQENPHMMVGVGGCVAQQEGAKIVKRNKSVDFVFGTHNLSLVPSLIDLRESGAPPQVAVNYRDEWETLPAGFVESDRVSVFVAISRGCNKNCTYCIVPTTRGPEVSRPIEELLREIRIAAHRGAKEVVLLGQTVNSYGLDLSPRVRFADLLAHVAEIPGIERIRFTSPHPQEIRDDFITLIRDNRKICRHVHMPLQSGNDRILKLMNRNYRRSRYLEIIAKLKEAVPDIGITTDIIVGFPGETEAEFRDTLELTKQVRFQDSFSFVFSPRPGTAAATMEDTVPYKTKLAWLQELQREQGLMTTEALSSWVGKEVEVLLEKPTDSDPSKLAGRTSQNITLNLTSSIPEVKRGEIVSCHVTEVARFSLRGEALKSQRQ